MSRELDDKRRARRLERYYSNQDLLQYHDVLLPELWGPGALRSNYYWVSKDPRIELQSKFTGQRLVVNLSYGTWFIDRRPYEADVGISSEPVLKRGESLLQLVQHITGTPERDALTWTAKWLKQHGLINAKRLPVNDKPERYITPTEDVMHVLTDMREMSDPNEYWLKEAKISRDCRYAGSWDYYDDKNNFAFTVVRFLDLHTEGKFYRKFGYFGRANGWQLESRKYTFPDPWPIYNQRALLERPNDPVLVVEGEKTAEAASRLLPSHVVITWPGGVNSIKYCDWSRLAQRDVTLWPDNDEPGVTCMKKLYKHLFNMSTSCDVAFVDVEKLPGIGKGWDLADPLPIGLDPFTVVRAAHDLPEWLVKFNREYFTVIEGGRFIVCQEQVNPELGHFELRRITTESFIRDHSAELVSAFDARGNPILRGAGEVWIEHPKHRRYNMIVFMPAQEAPVDCYNMWRGYSCGRRRGLPKKTLRFIWGVICSKRRAEFKYVMCWLARAVQKPAHPAQSALVLTGGKGTGKSFFGEQIFGALMKEHFRAVTSSEQLVGRFNGHLRDCVAVLADEAFYAGDRRHAGQLAAMITQSMLSYERKGMDPVMAYNRMHLVLASEHDWVVPAGLDERRFCVLRVSSDHVRDTNYFSDLQESLEESEREQLLNMLLELNVEDWSPLVIPQNIELAQQKGHNLEPHLDWLLNKVEAGNWRDEQPVSELYNEYIHYCEQIGLRSRKSSVALGMALRTALGSDVYQTKFRSVGNVKGNWVTWPEADVRKALTRYGLRLSDPPREPVPEQPGLDDDVPF